MNGGSLPSCDLVKAKYAGSCHRACHSFDGLLARGGTELSLRGGGEGSRNVVVWKNSFSCDCLQASQSEQTLSLPSQLDVKTRLAPSKSWTKKIFKFGTGSSAIAIRGGVWIEFDRCWDGCAAIVVDGLKGRGKNRNKGRIICVRT